MLDPAGPRIDLGELLVGSSSVAPPSEHRATTHAGRARIDGYDAAPHLGPHARHGSQRRRFLVERLGRCDGPVLVRRVGAGR